MPMSASTYDDAAVHCVRIYWAMCCHKALELYTSTDEMIQ